MYVVLHCFYGTPERAVGFTNEAAAVTYVKPYLKEWDIYNDAYQCSVNALSNVEDTQALIEEEAIYTLQVWKVEMMG